MRRQTGVTSAVCIAVLALVTACTGSTPAPNRRASAARPGTYVNPVFDHDAPDPSIIRAPDGTYYAYTTQSIYLDLVEIPILQSPDLVHWHEVADAFRGAPSWVNGGPAGDMWAPHILYWRGKYLLYYAGRRLDGGDMAIGVAVATTPRGPFRDLGHPILTRSRGQPAYTAIDPFVLADHDRLYLYWGSDGQPIRVVSLSNDGLRVTGKPRSLVNAVPRRGKYGGLGEGAWVLPHDGYFYLTYSVGDCCSEEANYSVFVARSRSPTGPFEQGPDNPILHENLHFWAVGHNATVQDGSGQDWIVYHARLRSSPSDDRDLMLDRIDWRDGWPVVNGGNGPSWQPESVPRA